MFVCVCASVFSNVQKGKLHIWRHLPTVSKGCLTFFDLSSGAEVIDKALEVSKKMVDVIGILTALSFSVLSSCSSEGEDLRESGSVQSCVTLTLDLGHQAAPSLVLLPCSLILRFSCRKDQSK